MDCGRGKGGARKKMFPWAKGGDGVEERMWLGEKTFPPTIAIQ
jgi:hypothetical protein